MALDFPDAPATGTTFLAPEGSTYTYDGTRWVIATTTDLENPNLRLGDTGITITDTGANGNAVVFVDGTNVAYFTSAGFTAINSFFRIADPTDQTKKATFQAASITTGTTRTLTFPDVSAAIVVSTANQTLSSKTFDNTSTITVTDANLTLVDDAITSKQLNFQLSSITANNTRTLTVPNANGNIFVIENTGTLTTISNSTFNNTNSANIKTKSFTIQNSANTTRQAQFSAALGPEFLISPVVRTHTLPDANTTLATTDLVQTLTLKTLDNAIFTGTTLVNDNIIDKARLVDHSIQTESLGTLTGTGTTNVNIANASYFTVTMTSNARTFAFINSPGAGHAVSFFMEITNGGLATITWPTAVRWTQPNAVAGYPNGTPPLLTASGTDLLAFTTSNAGTTYRGSFAMKDSK